MTVNLLELHHSLGGLNGQRTDAWQASCVLDGWKSDWQPTRAQAEGSFQAHYRLRHDELVPNPTSRSTR